jgi:cytochrome c oxidase subunit IV
MAGESRMKMLAFLLWVIYFTVMTIGYLIDNFSGVNVMISGIVLIFGIGIPAAILGESE